MAGGLDLEVPVIEIEVARTGAWHPGTFGQVDLPGWTAT